MILKLASRLLRETDPRLLARFAWSFGGGGLVAVRRFRRRLARGEVSPAFWFLSITSECNLRCRGCWVSVDGPPRRLDAGRLDRLIVRARREGGRFFGILGGEPLLHPELFDLLARHRDCYFQVFTNGTLLTDAIARRLRELGNVTPLVSIEGREVTSDRRRGGTGVYARALEALEHCRRHRLITGVATSLCRENIDELLTRGFLDELVARGVHYAWYYIYRPVGRDPAPELVLSPEQVRRARRFLVFARRDVPLILVYAYWDYRGRALCPAAVGISHRLSPAGDIEPCPPIQFAAERIAAGDDALKLAAGSAFLRAFRELAARTTRGCILMERPDLLGELVSAHGARDSSGRGTAAAELAAMQPACSHHLPGEELPELSWPYRFAKKHWFFGFGAYG